MNPSQQSELGKLPFVTASWPQAGAVAKPEARGVPGETASPSVRRKRPRRHLTKRLLNGLFGRMAMFAPGGYSLRPSLHRWRGVKLGKHVWISQWVYLDELYPEAVSIGDNCTIGLRTSVFSHFHWGPRRDADGFKPVVIESNVFIGPHCVILPGVRIGEGAVIKACSVVARNIPPRVFWGDPAGRPLARITTPLTPESCYEDFIRGLKPLNSGKGLANQDVDTIHGK